MKRVLYSLLLALLSMACQAQPQWRTSLDEALLESQKSKRPVLVNCYVQWAGPSVLMDSVVLREPQLVEWIGQRFVPLRLDMKTEEGKAVAERYGVRSYAHFLVLTPKGELQHRISGGYKADEFRLRLEEALRPETSLLGSQRRLTQKRATAMDTLRYLRALRTAGDGETFRQVGEAFAQRQSPASYLQPEYWVCAGLVMRYRSDHLNYLIDQRPAFVRAHGEDAVNRMLESALCRHLMPWAEGKIQPIASRSDLDQLLETVESAQLPDSCATRLVADLSRLRTEGQVQACLDLMRQRGDALRGYPGVRTGLELTFSFPGMTRADSLAVVAYLDEAVQRERGKNSRQLADFRDGLCQGIAPAEGGVEFRQLTFDEALKQAEGEGKLLFVDCMTSWCGPCRGMARNVFPLPRVGEYMNQHYVSLKIDMETGEGPALSRRYKVKAYPTMLVLRPDGSEVTRLVGYKSAEMLLESLQKCE
ncbi:MAG: thioredoxin family protein [Bacteroidaceae bacterium]|nr:thioredoxin family protein [Bacteroidaceae bacterium]